MIESEPQEIPPEIKEFIDQTFFQTLQITNSQLQKLEREEITMKQFRYFILEQRVYFAERFVQQYHTISLRSQELEETLLIIGKELVEG